MSLLNLEQNGPKLYVPVEQAQLPPLAPTLQPVVPTNTTDTTTTTTTNTPAISEEEPMQLDDTKHKVYIYNLDDELSDSDTESSTPREGRLVFLPDIEKHLRANRIPVPRPIVPNRDGELAGMQMVLYQPDGPKSISVPKEQDSVRRAIVAARERVREKQALERSGSTYNAGGNGAKKATISFATPVKFPSPLVTQNEDMTVDDQSIGQASSSAAGYGSGPDAGYDPDAMDID
ncbi:hypothetical protein N0V93_003076 [Gnomoniopsis smithogilvyi]|uniref:Uncharacterized protein n=1 Tax=Gnomoniopsis smithogilvyi TaxID=1191159 RepID=A0A9W8Z019_9PEZI|nr:hypothetical protein N0V93_003076 [Gnomoniopsis smithogilvyi]